MVENKILLLGANGQVGTQLQSTLAPLGKIIACARKEADLEKPGQLRKIIQNVK